MNDAFLHLAINHLPIFSTFFGVLILAWGLWKKNASIRNIALVLFILGAAGSYIAVETGEGAEDIVEENVAAVSHDAIHSHEEAAEITLWFSMITGVLSVLALFTSTPDNNKRLEKVLMGVLLVAALTTLGSLAYTAYEGGKINHPEAHTAAAEHTIDDQ